MKYIDVYRMIKKAADEYSLGTMTDRPAPGTYGAALNQRYAQATGTKPGVFGNYTPSMNLAAGMRDKLRSQEVTEARDLNAQWNANELASADNMDDKSKAWIKQQLIQGGQRNANSWMQTKKLAPQVSGDQFKNQSVFNKMTPKTQQNFLNYYNSMASNRKPSINTNIG